MLLRRHKNINLEPVVEGEDKKVEELDGKKLEDIEPDVEEKKATKVGNKPNAKGK